jgi:hypothetical protein
MCSNVRVVSGTHCITKRGRQQLLGLAGDGQVDLVELAGPTPGFNERTEDERWEVYMARRNRKVGQ